MYVGSPSLYSTPVAFAWNPDRRRVPQSVSDAVDAAADEIAQDVVRDVAWEVAGAVGSLVEESWRSELLPRWT